MIFSTIVFLAYVLPAIIGWMLSMELKKRNLIEYDHIEWKLSLVMPVFNILLAMTLMVAMTTVWHFGLDED